MTNELPDFATVYANGPLSPRMAARVWLGATSIGDHLDPEFAGEVVWLSPLPLPSVVERFVDDDFTMRFRQRLAVVTERLAMGRIGHGVTATCTADEMAIHLSIAYAQLWDAEDWIDSLPGAPDLDVDYEHALGVLLDDDDVVMLYNPELCVEQLDDYIRVLEDTMHVMHLHPRDWFIDF